MFFKQLTRLCPKGYHIVAAQPPPYFSFNEFVIGLDAFLDHLAPKEVCRTLQTLDPGPWTLLPTP